MKKIETLLIGAALTAAVVVAGGAVLRGVQKKLIKNSTYTYETTKFGAFLAAQHAIYINDFESANRFAAVLGEMEYPIVQNTKMLAEYLSGSLPASAKLLEKEKSVPAQLVYDTYLVKEGKWDELYKRHKGDESALMAPMRIWSSVATGHAEDAIKFIETLPTATPWKHFVRGQIYAEQGDIQKAADEFAKVQADFLNLNDYMYIMSFYAKNDMTAPADALRAEFTAMPGGMFLLDYDGVPAWDTFAGTANALGFSLVQNVSHTQIMMYSDLAILMLRMAQIVSPGIAMDSDAINYYLGQYFFHNNGDYARHFDQINSASPFYPFAILRKAEKSGDVKAIARVLNEYPLFVPAVNSMIAHHISHDNRRAALRVVNAALNDERLSDVSHAFFLKSRAQIHYVFGDYKAANADIRAAADVLVADPEILALQAKIWAAQGREIETAYEYAMSLVQRAPADIFAWDTLGRVVTVREGADAALDLLERVGQIANNCSALFEQLGDLHAATGDTAAAAAAYRRAIELGDDGVIVIPNVEKKLRKLK